MKYLVLLTSLFITPQYLSCSEVMLSAGTVLSALPTPLECLGSLACGVCLLGCVAHCCCNESPEERARKKEIKRVAARNATIKEAAATTLKVVKGVKEVVALAQDTKTLFSSSKKND